ncbi:GNAT family N-acetyltransferase [Ornithinibacillus halophilus]|uniref:Ribosomal protein S18 acetylase RimI n=1 Tax=Ornithinibacillus halophilus TaxID=930117 RepID=A0A1M5G957_9BACI|nr:GNAT family N-acetyltransferase [Ornithinibacillus halophilus]SHG00285.1 Ribosomal protein S18 acetylase RimI [Ornithinibacillus halophilus]
MKIRKYKPIDEKDWLRCRIISFLDTSYFDNVLKEKETYDNSSIELVAVHEEQVVGLIDIEYEEKEKTVCTQSNGLGGMIWHIAVHPDYQRLGIGKKLLTEAEKLARECGLTYLEAWTRDDPWVLDWYKKSGFVKTTDYLHVYLEGTNEIQGTLTAEVSSLIPQTVFAHYTGENKEEIRKKFNRVHDCNGFVKYL